ncbi:hypothetical protein Patl1_05260 [Pistacia atlantica]|uniref:Uncharacterized protein n=1 Tax=Pistacia atlantica TaxID=434234 RepID=A0ACC1BQ45_9ROSI|nr:hypothetical protein Patl1_05260 [Pistacia atlantica]
MAMGGGAIKFLGTKRHHDKWLKDTENYVRFAAFMPPLTSGRVNIASTAVYISKIGLSIAIRCALSRRTFSITPNGPEILLLDYPSHQRRLLPLLAKTYAMSSAANYTKMLYVNRTPQSNKTTHVISSAFKATFTWHNQQTLQARNFKYTSIIYIHVKWSDSDYRSFRNAVKHVEDKA